MRGTFLKTISIVVVLCIATGFATEGNAELRRKRCGTKSPSQETLAAVEENLRVHEARMTLRDLSPISVSVAVHVIQDSQGTNEVTSEQIQRQIDVLNADYAGKAVFTLTSSETTVNDSWFEVKYASDADSAMREALHVGGASTLNIYLHAPYSSKPGDLLGIAQFPWEYARYGIYDGISILYSTLPGGSERGFNKGKTVSHEAGHWLGLFHTFEPPNSDKNISNSNNGCKGKGDKVSDTPAEKIPHYTCKVTDSCPAKGKDPIRNIMNYTPDACMRNFSKGQLTRTNTMWSAYRSS